LKKPAGSEILRRTNPAMVTIPEVSPGFAGIVPQTKCDVTRLSADNMDLEQPTNGYRILVIAQNVKY
jgi:hypothetical protein